MQKGSINVQSENIFPIIKKFLYSDTEIFLRELVSNAVDASQTMGKGFLNTIRVIVLPLIYTNILIGGILLFVDILKELPITLLLRPFNFETLATYVYQYASDELLQESSFAALIIIVVGLGPVIFLNTTLQRVSQKKESN